ncbi:uncharacterized protein P174DRAFT_445091 [Aspergillus novofumigatus IBT 16806]|uniref:Uncharacterized protein n=1 Tax=Aspergillus novofumigatus (strain IBT 16806) TaxID=1392255 RepID=A0A2I1BXI1_ASPN1|nr:uncharacterized protein P174DRAFT_445091 [Aspergillus novofumigatus IBT 16806]PKX90086.1 hypothetical protein P174DRAFT_445091 [Aspergillus novofumigatus IBT 16806]
MVQKNVVGCSVLAGNTGSGTVSNFILVLTLLSKIKRMSTRPVNPHAPTFPPTAIDYYNYPWRDVTSYTNLQTSKN